MRKALVEKLSPNSDDSSIGNLLLRMGVITHEMLSKALLVQGQMKEKVFLGEVFIELGMISRENLVRALELQNRMRDSNGNGGWTDSLFEAMNDNVNENIRQVSKIRSALAALGVKDD